MDNNTIYIGNNKAKEIKLVDENIDALKWSTLLPQVECNLYINSKC